MLMDWKDGHNAPMTLNMVATLKSRAIYFPQKRTGSGWAGRGSVSHPPMSRWKGPVGWGSRIRRSDVMPMGDGRLSLPQSSDSHPPNPVWPPGLDVMLNLREKFGETTQTRLRPSGPTAGVMISGATQSGLILPPSLSFPQLVVGKVDLKLDGPTSCTEHIQDFQCRKFSFCNQAMVFLEMRMIRWGTV